MPGGEKPMSIFVTFSRNRAGLVLGMLVICVVGNGQFKLSVGILAIGILLFEFLREQMGWTKVAQSRGFQYGCGVLTGLTTMLGNAAGVISAVYFASQNLDKKRVYGTGDIHKKVLDKQLSASV